MTFLEIVGGLGISTIIVSIIGFFYDRRRRLRAYYKIIWKKSSSLEPHEIMEWRGYPKYGFREYYFERKEDELVRKRMEHDKNVLIIGSPLSGKTRIIYQVLNRLERPYDVIVPNLREINMEDFRIPYRFSFWRKRVLVLDDLEEYVQQKNSKQLLQEFLKNKIIIVASCRKGPEYDTVSRELESELSLFGEPLEIPKISESKVNEIAREIGMRLPSRFDGNIGSLFLPLDTMKNRFRECTEVEKGVLKSIKRLYYAGIYEGREIFSKKRIRNICEKKEEIRRKEFEWSEIFGKLETKGFIEIIDEDQIEVEEAYIERVIEDKNLSNKNRLQILEEMRKLFSDDDKALAKIGNKAWYVGVTDLQRTEYMKTAVKAHKEALGIRTLEQFPIQYAMTQDNLGTAYRTLSEVEDKAENCRKAITAYKEALRIRTLEQFPEDYATTHNNLGNVYAILSKVRNKSENCRKAITAYKKALKVRTLEQFPEDYATTHNNLGNAYKIFSEAENKAENCKKAIEIFEEALKVRTFEQFPVDYAATQNNLGNAYRTLSEVENKAENCRKAITAYKEALGIRTLEQFPIQYAMTQDNLGTAYRTLSEVENKAENCRKAITAFKEVLKVYTEDGFPDLHKFVESNLTEALIFCSESRLLDTRMLMYKKK